MVIKAKGNVLLWTGTLSVTYEDGPPENKISPRQYTTRLYTKFTHFAIIILKYNLLGIQLVGEQNTPDCIAGKRSLRSTTSHAYQHLSFELTVLFPPGHTG